MRKHRIAGIISVLALVLSMFTVLPEGVFRAEAAEQYPIVVYVNGLIFVDSDNKNDILGKGNKELVYHPETHTLDINKSITANSPNEYLIERVQVVAGGDAEYEVYINVKNNVTLQNTASTGGVIKCDFSTTVKGSGKLTAKAGSAAAAICLTNGTLTVKNADLALSGAQGIKGDPEDPPSSTLKIVNSTVAATGIQYAVGDFSPGISLSLCKLTSPEYGRISEDKGYITSKGSPAKSIKIVPSPDTYALRVCGVDVDTENKADILGNGKKEASYDPETNTLTLNKSLTCNDKDVILNHIKGLTVKTAAGVTLSSSAKSGIYSDSDFTVTGKKLLKLNCPAAPAIDAPGAEITIRDTSVEATGGAKALTGGKLIIDNSKLTASGSEAAAGGFTDGIELKDIMLVTPDGGRVSGGSICSSDGKPAKSVSTAPLPKTYDLAVCDIAVASDNDHDILGKGKKEAVYDPETNTLILSGDITYGEGTVISNHIPGLTIRVDKDVTVTSTGTGAGVLSDADLTVVTGDHRLTVVAPNYAAFWAPNSTLTLRDADITADSGQWGFTGNPGTDKLVVINSNISATGGDFAIGDFGNGIVLEDCIFDSDCGSREIADGNVIDPATGERAKSVEIMRCPSIWLYDLTVNGYLVSNWNCGDILGSGEVSYDPDSNTLRLCGDISNSEGGIILNNIPDLTIEVVNDVTLHSNFDWAIKSNEDMTVTGSGKLTLDTPMDTGLCTEGATLTLREANINISRSLTAISGGPAFGGGKLIIDASDVIANGGTAAITNFDQGIELIDCEVTSPADYTISSSVLSGGSRAESVTVRSTLVKYDLYVCNTQVTSKNAADILGTGKKEAVYAPKTKTLTLSADITFDEGTTVFNNIKGLTVKAAKNITVSNSTHSGFYTSQNMTVTGTGRLTVKCPGYACFYVSNATLTVKDANITAQSGQWAFTGNPGTDKLIIDNSNITAAGGDFAIGDLGSGIVLKGCTVTSPSGASVSGGNIYNKGGTERAKSVIIAVGTALMGDVNIDGKVNMRDYALLQKYLMDPKSVDINTANADLTGDGKVNLRDYSALQKLILNQA